MKKKLLNFMVTFFLFVFTFGFTTCKLDDIFLDIYAPAHFFMPLSTFEYEDAGVIKTCIQYQNGYTVSQGRKLIKVAGGKGLNSTGTTESFTLGPGLSISERLNAKWIIRKAETSIANKTADAITLIFEQKYAELANYIGYNGHQQSGMFNGSEGFNAGIYIDRPIGVWDESIWIPLGWGDSTGEYGLWINVPGISFLIYNRQQEKVYIVKNEFVKIWKPHWGDPVNDMGIHSFKVDGQNFTRTSQLFINGYVHMDGSVPAWVPAEYRNVGGEHTYTLK